VGGSADSNTAADRDSARTPDGRLIKAVRRRAQVASTVAAPLASVPAALNRAGFAAQCLALYARSALALVDTRSTSVVVIADGVVRADP
jgi:hypothetical protein